MSVKQRVSLFFLLTLPLGAAAQGLDSLGPPPIARDTIRITKPVRKSALPFSGRKLTLQNRIARDVTQVPLPEGFAATFVDSATVSFEHVIALEDYFTAVHDAPPDTAFVFDVLAPDTAYRTTAFVKAWAYQMASLKLREVFVFQSEDERKNFKETLEKNFRRRVDIEVTVRSRYAGAARLDTSNIDIYLERNGVRAPPQSLHYSPVKTRMDGGFVWYERSVKLEFPRFVRARDFWRMNRIDLILQPRGNAAPNTLYRLTFHAPRSG